MAASERGTVDFIVLVYRISHAPSRFTRLEVHMADVSATNMKHCIDPSLIQVVAA